MAVDAAPLLTAARAEGAAFARALADPASAQETLLARIVGANADSAFVREHGFAACDGIAAFRAAVPVRDYAGHRPWLDRAIEGETGVLTSEAVIAFEETGGTTDGGKLIPCTDAGLAGFRRAVLPWLDDLARRRPAAFAGPVYATISPATRQPRTTPGGVPIGLDSDAAYLGPDLAPAFAALLAVPPTVARIADPAAWQVATLAALIEAADLAFVSLWSPTFLLALIEALARRIEAVLPALTVPARRRLERAAAGPAIDTQRLWPRLDCISCWRDGASEAFARRLGEAFPHAAIEAKGLLATEAAVTVPWGGHGACVPALLSTFIELVDESGEARLVTEAEPGHLYRVVVTTEGGLYRYDLGDRVECTGRAGAAALLRFVGRDGAISDLVGEKLDDAFVAAALSGLPGPAMLAPVADPPGYCIVSADPLEAAQVNRVEAMLRRNPQYDHARRIGQLAALRVVHRPDLSSRLTAGALDAGRRMGDAKPVALAPGWRDDWPGR